MRKVVLASFVAILAAALLPKGAGADAAGDALLDKCIAAEAKLTSLQADFTLQGEGIQPTHGKLDLKKPNIAHIVYSRQGSSNSFVTHSDGKKLITFSTEDMQFSKEDVDIAGGNVTQSIRILEAAVFYNSDLLDRMRFNHPVKLVATATIGGTACKVLQVTGVGKNVWKVFIGPDNLLRGYSERVVNGDQVETLDTRLINLRVNAALPSAALAWTLPRGARSAESVAASRETPSSGTSGEEQGLLPVGKTAPAFNLKMLEGGSVALASAVKGNKITLVNFWNAGCGPCREELPHLSKMLTELRGKGFDIFSVNLGDDTATVARIWKDGGFTMHAVLGGEKVSDLYQIQAIPTNYVLGPDGKILARFMGFDEQGIRQALAKAGVK